MTSLDGTEKVFLTGQNCEIPMKIRQPVRVDSTGAPNDPTSPLHPGVWQKKNEPTNKWLSQTRRIAVSVDAKWIVIITIDRGRHRFCFFTLRCKRIIVGGKRIIVVRHGLGRSERIAGL